MLMESTTNQSDASKESHMATESNTTECCMAVDVNTSVGEIYEMVENSIVVPLTESEGSPKLEPYVGMEFESEETSRIFYNEYAKRVGFSVRVSVNRRSKRDGTNIGREFVCYKEGFRPTKYLSKRPQTRQGCKAMIKVKKEDSGKWVITKFVKEHNHALGAPREVSVLRSHKRIHNTVKNTTGTSYAKNSSLQEKAILKIKPIAEQAIVDLYCTTFPKSLGIAYLGCSSEPNPLSVIAEIIDAVERKCHFLRRASPEFRVFLNDLPGNDFNPIFRSLPAFYEKRKKEKGDEFGSCFIAGVPRSFYGRVFSSKSLHFVHSSYTLHWLSQVPLKLQSKEVVPLNKGKIYISMTSPPYVWDAYWEQFQMDFSLFLKSRSEEIVDGGRMVLTLLGRLSPYPWAKESGYTWELLGDTLNEMVSKGLIEQEKIDSFNVPFYAPTPVELEAEIEREGSFTVDRMEIFKLNLDASDDNGDYNQMSGERAAKIKRAVSESMLSNHFGEEIIGDLFERYGEVLGEHLSREKTKYTNILISMKKKG